MISCDGKMTGGKFPAGEQLINDEQLHGRRRPTASSTPSPAPLRRLASAGFPKVALSEEESLPLCLFNSPESVNISSAAICPITAASVSTRSFKSCRTLDAPSVDTWTRVSLLEL